MATVLILDDEPQVLALYRRVLEIAHFDTVGASSAAEAIRLCHIANFDLLLLDVTMADGGALEVLQGLQGQASPPPRHCHDRIPCRMRSSSR